MGLVALGVAVALWPTGSSTPETAGSSLPEPTSLREEPGSLDPPTDAGPPADAGGAATPDVLPDLPTDVVRELAERRAALAAAQTRVEGLTERMLELEMAGDLTASDRLAEERQTAEDELERLQDALEALETEHHLEEPDPLYFPDE